MADIITGGIVILLIGGAVAYIIKQKKRGARCIGCSMGGSCSGKCSCNTDLAAEKILSEIKESGRTTES